VELFRIQSHRREITFLSVTAIMMIVLFLMPTGFEELINRNVERVRAEVIATDNSEVQQLGIVKVGTQMVTVRILQGRFKGVETTGVNELIGTMELDTMFAPGDKALVTLDPTIDGQGIAAANIIDHYRIRTELLLFFLFFVFLVLFAGWTGLKAFISFVFTGLAIWKLLLPGILYGYNPIIISLAVVTLLTAVIIFLIAGISKKGVVAFLGAFAGVAVTCVLSLVFGKAFHIHGAVKQFSETLLYSGYPHLDLYRIFLSGIFLASSGAVMDIAMDIAASMYEVKQNHPAISTGRLILSGITVGRAVVGTMTTTLLLAYSGGYTAMLMVFIAQGTPLINVLNITYVSAEILHTLVGSFGLVLVAPLTALIGGIAYNRTTVGGSLFERTADQPIISE